MKRYKELAIKVVVFSLQDIITNSQSEAADDLGEWNDEWFSNRNG